jgi:hypothetical protein
MNKREVIHQILHEILKIPGRRPEEMGRQNVTLTVVVE